MTYGKHWSKLKQPSVKYWNRFGNIENKPNPYEGTPGSREECQPFWIEEKDLFLLKNGIRCT